MKKYVVLLTVTLLALAVLILPGFIANGSVLETELYTVTTRDMAHTVSASGQLRYRSGKAVRTENAGILNSLFVQNGDKVKKGDPLFSYDRIDSAYSAMLEQYGGVEGLEALVGTLNGGDIPAELLQEARKFAVTETVNAPRDGIVTDLSCAPDELLEKNTTVLRLSEGRQPEIPVRISETEIEQIKPGQSADIQFSALPEAHFTGEVTDIAEEAEQSGGITGKETTVEVTISLPEPEDSKLRVGYSAVCSITTDTDHAVLVLPYEMIRTDDEGDYVYLAEGDRAEFRRITTGNEYQDGVQILTGLKSGDRVIVNADQCTNGQKLSIKQESGKET